MEKKISDYSFKRPKRYTFLKVIPAYLVYLSLGIIKVLQKLTMNQANY